MAPGGTKEQVVEATLETLRRGGLKNASARAIARTGGFNSALIFYYFGSLDGVLLAALDASSAANLARYREALEGIDDAGELVATVLRLYREDVASGHSIVVAELIGASHARPELRPAIVERTRPWIDLIEATLRRVMAGSPLASLADPRDLASAVMATSLGINLFAYLDDDAGRVDDLFALAERLLPALAALLGAGADSAPIPSRGMLDPTGTSE
jgi:AcrR family transcriptional regulator